MQRLLGIAKIHVAGITLNSGELAIGGGEFAEQRRVGARLAGEAIQIDLRVLEDELSSIGGAREVSDGVMDFKDQRVGDFADVVEALLCANALLAGDAGFVQRADESKQKEKYRNGRSEDASATATPYIFGADSLFGPDITGFGGGTTDLGASDLDVVDQITLGPGATVGLGHVLFDVSPTAPTEIVSIDIVGFPGTSLADDLANNVPIESFSGGKFQINGPVAGVSEPGTLVLLLMMVPIVFCRRMIRG